MFVTGKDVVLWIYFQLILGIIRVSFSISEASGAHSGQHPSALSPIPPRNTKKTLRKKKR
jgi:hypothetical protein